MVTSAKSAVNTRRMRSFLGEDMLHTSVKPALHFRRKSRAEEMALNRLINLPWRLSKAQLAWLKNRLKDRRDTVRALAIKQYNMRFPSKIEWDDAEDDFKDDVEFLEDDEMNME